MNRLTHFKLKLLSRPRLRQLTQARKVRRAIVVMVFTYILANVLLAYAVKTRTLNLQDPLYNQRLNHLKEFPQYWGPSDKTRVIAMGSSRTQLAFNPFEFMVLTNADAFNFGIPAAGSMTSGLYLRRLFDQGFLADIVLIEWHPGFTAKPNTGRALEDNWLFDSRLLEHEYESLAAWGNPRVKPDIYGWKGYVSAFQYYRAELVQRWFPKMAVVENVMNEANVTLDRGYYPGLPHNPATFGDGLKVTKKTYGSVFPDYHVGGPGLEALKDMIAVTRAHGATPVVVVTAETQDVQVLYGERANKELTEAFKTLDCQVIVARDWLKTEETVDGHHATKLGSIAFTQRLVKELEPLLLHARTR